MRKITIKNICFSKKQMGRSQKYIGFKSRLMKDLVIMNVLRLTVVLEFLTIVYYFFKNRK